MPEEIQANAWKIDLNKVEITVHYALSKRKAFLSDETALATLPSVWRDRSKQIQKSKFRTHFAAVVVGLVARATDATSNPLSLQVGPKPIAIGRYSAQSVWAKFFSIAQGKISVNGLKNSPFVNGIYDQKRTLEKGWAANANTAFVDEITDWMSEVADYSRESAEEALIAFLVEVPDAVAYSDLFLNSVSDLSVGDVLDAVEEFLTLDTENGRRGQAFVKACLVLVQGENVKSPVSINDPSRKSPGDVWHVDETHQLAAEAKQKPVQASDISHFVKEVGTRLSGGVAMYAAMENKRVKKSLNTEWEDISRHEGVLVSIFDSASELLRDAVVWSGLPFPLAISRLFEIYRLELIHLEVAPTTIFNWNLTLAKLGFIEKESEE